MSRSYSSRFKSLHMESITTLVEATDKYELINAYTPVPTSNLDGPHLLAGFIHKQYSIYNRLILSKSIRGVYSTLDVIMADTTADSPEKYHDYSGYGQIFLWPINIDRLDFEASLIIAKHTVVSSMLEAINQLYAEARELLILNMSLGKITYNIDLCSCAKLKLGNKTSLGYLCAHSIKDNPIILNRSASCAKCAGHGIKLNVDYDRLWNMTCSHLASPWQLPRMPKPVFGGITAPDLKQRCHLIMDTGGDIKDIGKLMSSDKMIPSDISLFFAVSNRKAYPRFSRLVKKKTRLLDKLDKVYLSDSGQKLTYHDYRTRCDQVYGYLK